MLIKPTRRALIGGLGLAIASPAIVRAAGGWFPLTKGAGWTPASVTTAFWYDASNAGSITKDGSNNVSQWNDLSGNARNLTQTPSNSYDPIYTTTVLNGLPGLHFINNNSSTQDCNMQTGVFTLAQPFTTVAVFKTGSGGPNNNIGGQSAFGDLLDGDLNEAAANRASMLMGRTDTTPANRATYTAPSAVDTTVIFAANTAYHYAVVFNGASSSSDINGTTSSGDPGSFGIVNGISIGPNFSGSGNTANGIDLYLCEMFCIPDTTHLANALAYVSAKWGV